MIPDMDRRTFIKATLVGILAFMIDGTIPDDVSARKIPEGRLSLYNTHTGERLKVSYRDASGRYNREALRELDYILRCHYTQKVRPMDIRTIEFLNAVDKALGGKNEIHIVSGYRSPGYNNLLAKGGSGVAKNSLHQFGKAIDISIPGIDLKTIRQKAIDMRYGGVGYYPETGFIHLDSGRFRTW